LKTLSLVDVFKILQDQLSPQVGVFITRSWQFILALLIGGTGGVIFYLANIPLPWTLGAILFGVASSLIGVKSYVPRQFAMIARIILGLVIGSRLQPDFFEGLYRWSESIIALTICVIVATAVCYFYLRRFAGYSSATAYYSAMPGGLAQMTELGREVGGDERVISMIHTFRVLLVVALTPIIVIYSSGADFSSASPSISLNKIDGPFDLFLMILCSTSGFYIAKFLKIPAGHFVGPLFMFGFASAAGFTHSSPPGDISAFCQVLVGAGYGSRFRGVKIAFLWQTFRFSMISTFIHINFTILFAFILVFLGSFDIPNIVLAYAPGGQLEMSLLAVALAEDISFISVHHLLRAIGVMVIGPYFYRYFIQSRVTE
jgi:hypothetical protein